MIGKDSKLFCENLKKYPSTQNIKTCLIRSGDMDKNIADAVRLGYKGLSCNYQEKTVTAENISKARQAGLIVQLWTPYYESELLSAFKLKPDFVQTDNVKAKKLLNVK